MGDFGVADTGGGGLGECFNVTLMNVQLPSLIAPLFCSQTIGNGDQRPAGHTAVQMIAAEEYEGVSLLDTVFLLLLLVALVRVADPLTSLTLAGGWGEWG